MARCKRCHRKLKGADAQKVGYGKVCYKKVFGKPFPTTQKHRYPTVHFQNFKDELEEEIPPLFDDKYFK